MQLKASFNLTPPYRKLRLTALDKNIALLGYSSQKRVIKYVSIPIIALV